MAQYRIPVEETFSWQRPVIDKDLNTPPATPAKGDRYIVGPSPTGDWVTHAGHIAWCSNATGPVWSFDIPAEGWECAVLDENLNYRHSGSAWVIVPATHTQGTDTTLGTMAADIAMNTHKLTGLAVPSTAGDSVRATAKITEVLLESATDLKHTQGTDTGLGTMAADIAMGTHKLTGLSVPVSSGDSLRQTTITTEATLDATVTAKPTYDAGVGGLLINI